MKPSSPGVRAQREITGEMERAIGGSRRGSLDENRDANWNVEGQRGPGIIKSSQGRVLKFRSPDVQWRAAECYRIKNLSGLKADGLLGHAIRIIATVEYCRCSTLS